MRLWALVIVVFLLCANVCMAQQAPQVPPFSITPSARVGLFSDSVTIRQDGQQDITLNSLGFASRISVWQVGLMANRQPLYAGYWFTPSISMTGSGKLNVPFQLGSTLFGPQSSGGTGTTTNDIVSIDVSAARHRIEIAYAIISTPQMLLLPRVAVEVFPAKFSILNMQSQKSESWGGSPSVFKGGLAFQERIPYFLVFASLDLMTGSRASGYDAEIGLTFLPPLPPGRSTIFISGGYHYTRAVFGFDGGSVNILAGGPFIQAEIPF